MSGPDEKRMIAAQARLDAVTTESLTDRECWRCIDKLGADTESQCIAISHPKRCLEHRFSLHRHDRLLALHSCRLMLRSGCRRTQRPRAQSWLSALVESGHHLLSSMREENAVSQQGIPENVELSHLLDDAKKAFYQDPNVIGVGIGERRRGGETHSDELVLIVYVQEKAEAGVIDSDKLIPPDFEGMATDIVEPFSQYSRGEALGFAESHQHSDDMSYVDWPRLHSQWSSDAEEVIASQGVVHDIGDVCVIEDDGTLIQTVNGQQVVDFVRAYELFRTTHNDEFDFVTFFTDTANGMPPQGGSSWYRFVFNDVEGIGFGPFDQRAGYASTKLQGIMFLNQGHFPVWRYVMLQEQGHRWSAFARYKDSQTGPIQTDHLLGGWGHWALNLDDDRSPMDYDVFDWVESASNYDRVQLTTDERAYCDLDLYLMGLLGPGDVDDFFLLSNVSPISGTLFSADKKVMTVQKILMAEGPRVPDVSTSQKSFKNAFVVLTGSAGAASGLVGTVDSLRSQFQSDFADATRNLAHVDTALAIPKPNKRWW